MKKHARSNSAIYLLERTLRQMRQALQQRFNETGLPVTVDQWLLLCEIEKMPGISQRLLAERTSKDPASITRTLELMLDKKVIKRTQDKNDARKWNIHATVSGLKLLQACNRQVELFRAQTAKGLTQDELNLWRDTLDKLFENTGGQLS